MKIVKLELQNINSIKTATPVTIDFGDEMFQTTGLFAITGSTGSGKTTLLDAITIALYREVPRFNASHIKLGLSDVVSEGASEAMARVTFSNNGKIYEAFWSIRTKSRSGKLLGKPQETVRLKDLNSNKIIAEKLTGFNKKIEEVTQLNYDQFLRSMMLAQGEFASFLKANKKSKVELLDQIIGNDIYKQIGYSAAERVSAEKKILQEIEQRINTEDLLTGEKKKVLAKEKKDILKNIESIEKKAVGFNRVIDWYKKTREIEKMKFSLEKEKEELNVARQEKKGIVEALTLHSEAKPFENNLRDLNSKTEKIEVIQKALKLLVPEITGLTGEKQKAVNELVLKSRTFEEEKKTEDSWAPKLDEVTRFDQNIINLADVLTTNEKQVDEINADIKAREIELKQNGEKKEKFVNNLTDVVNYLNENYSVAEIRTRLNAWSVLLNNRKIKHDAKRAVGNEIEKLNEQLAGLDKTIESDKRKLIEKEGLFVALNKTISELKNRQKKLDVVQLNKKQTALIANKELLKEGIGISVDWFAKKQHQEQSVELVEIFAKELSEKLEELKNLNREIAISDKLLNEIERTLELEKKVKSLEVERQKLQHGKACPLCGSTHHPFVLEYRYFDFTETEKRCNAQKLKVEKLKKKIEQNRSGQLLTQQKMDIETRNIQTIITEIDSLNKKFEGLKLDIPISDKDALKAAYNTIGQELVEVRENIGKAGSLQQQIDEKTEKSSGVLSLCSTLRENLSVRKSQKTGFETNRADRQREIAEIEKELNHLENQLDAQLSPFGLKLPEPESTTVFIERIEKKIEDYSEKEEQKKNLENNLKIFAIKIKDNEARINSDKKIKEEKELVAEKMAKKLTRFKDDRNAMLPLEISVEAKRKELAEKTDGAKKEVDESRKRVNKLELLLAAKKSEQENLETNLNSLVSEIETLGSNLEIRLEGSRFADLKELGQALLNFETETSYRKVKRLLDDRETAIETKEKQIKTFELEQAEQRNFEISEEQAKDLFTDLEKEKSVQQQRIGEIKSTFERDSELRFRNENVIKEINTQKLVLKKWNTLFSLLGGTKDAFNIYVQRLTLNSLINHANLHLEKLNNRYSLQITGKLTDSRELNIELTDHYQTDMVRPVETCSGGESFLLSLSLALGLSDMASRNVKVESLFIDEGFGTLDDDLLETVISTLESLRSDGKIIGVISHVEKLKERITTQIQVIKKGNGVSEVQITA